MSVNSEYIRADREFKEAANGAFWYEMVSSTPPTVLLYRGDHTLWMGPYKADTKAEAVRVALSAALQAEQGAK